MRPALLAVALGLAILACTAKTDPTADATPAPAASEPAPVPAPALAPIEETVEAPAIVPAPEIVPVPDAAPEFEPTGELPSWCDIEFDVVTPIDVDTLDELLTEVLGSSEGGHAALCEKRGIGEDCLEGGPWFIRHEDGIHLIVRVSGGRYGWIWKIAIDSDGNEFSSLVADSSIDGSDPVDATLLMDEAEESCSDHDDDADDGEICGLVATYRHHIVITGLADDTFLVTTVSVDVEEHEDKRKNIADASVEIVGNALEISACKTELRWPLPAGAISLGTPQGGARAPVDAEVDEEAEAPAPLAALGPPASTDEVTAAGKRCGEGWSKFNAGDLAGAKLDIDAALLVLERAADEKGRRSLGACLYNRGRIAEREDEDDEARRLYRRSIAARPNDTVQARLDSLAR